jgi:NAD+ diphosphatase
MIKDIMPFFGPPFFSGATIDRADAIRTDPDAVRAQMLRPNARLLALNGIDPVLDAQGGLAWTSLTEAAADADFLFIGLQDGRPHFAQLPAKGAKLDARSRGVWRVLPMLSPDDAALYGAVRSVLDWHAHTGYCGNCGAPTQVAKAGWGRTCPACKTEHFPRVEPVVIMLAQFEGRILLGRQPAFPPGRYSALAGFVEVGESIEDAVIRELFEEAGVAAQNVRYIASQPWPFPSSLMIACIADVEDDAVTLDTNELEDAIWVDAADVEASMAGAADAKFVAPPTFAIAHVLLANWLAEQKRT